MKEIRDLSGKEVRHCLSCRSERMRRVLDLGNQPLANNLLTCLEDAAREPRFQLGIQVCESCWLVQLTHLVPPVDLFSSYVYFSSYSETMLRHAEEAVENYKDKLHLNQESFVVEIASNDGYLLKNFVKLGIPCLGVEPAENIAEVAKAAGIDTIVEFFGSESAAGIAQSRGKADLIIGNNVFAHVPDINDFARGLNVLLAPTGSACLEFPYARELFDRNEFDTIYHEHVFYFSLTPLVALFARFGLQIYHVDRLPIHGGSLRIWVGRKDQVEVDSTVTDLLEDEKATGLHELGYYESLAGRVTELKSSLLEKMQKIQARGGRIAAYGASAKGSTLLNYIDPPRGAIEFIADRSLAKQGKISPGLHLPIVPAEELALKAPDYALLLTWNFAEEVMQQQESFLQNGGRFIIPIPEVRLLPEEGALS